MDWCRWLRVAQLIVRPIPGVQDWLGAMSGVCVLLGVSIFPALLTKDIRWGLVGIMTGLFLLCAWAAYRLVADIEPRLLLKPEITPNYLDDVCWEAILRVENRSKTRINNCVGRIVSVFEVGNSQPEPSLLFQNQVIPLRWRGVDTSENTFD